MNVLLASVCVLAAVVESSPAGFQVKHTQVITAKPDAVWNSVIAVDRWWSSEHTYSGKASNLRLEPRAGGCFCETLPDGGGVVHMTVVQVRPNRTLVLSGGLGPLQSGGVAGAMTFQIAPEGDGSRLTLTYNVGGYYPGGLAPLAPIVDKVVGEQFGRLVALISGK